MVAVGCASWGSLLVTRSSPSVAGIVSSVVMVRFAFGVGWVVVGVLCGSRPRWDGAVGMAEFVDVPFPQSLV